MYKLALVSHTVSFKGLARQEMGHISIGTLRDSNQWLNKPEEKNKPKNKCKSPL